MQYLSFSPYYSGLSNVIMSYELALALSHITKRTIILPPDCWMLFLSRQDFSDYVDIWELLDKKYLLENFDCIEHAEVPEFEGELDKLKDQKSYTGVLKNSKHDVLNVRFGGTSLSESKFVLTNGVHDTEDFKSFSKARDIVNVKSSRKILHFENNLFGNFAYYVYAPGYEDRNLMKTKVNRACAYNSRFYELADKVKQTLGSYNAVHVRRNDFAEIRDFNLQEVNASDKLCNRLLEIYDTDVPLYIATDEKNESFFAEVKEKFNVFFFKDFGYNVNKIEEAVLEQVICSQAEEFYGTYLSTYTTRINVMRGLEGKQVCDYGGINHYVTAEQSGIDFSNAFPWHQNNGTWNWEWSYHFQWVKEIQDGILETTNV